MISVQSTAQKIDSSQDATPTTVRVQIKALPHGMGLPVPAYGTDHAAAFDIMAAYPDGQPFTLQPGTYTSVPTGFAFAIPNGFEMQVRGRSGLAARQGISVTHGTGTIDPDYRGELFVLLVNHGTAPLVIERGMRVAQGLITPVPRTVFEMVDTLPETTRGTGGLGSTGK
jgi:dUTP pyrophosphatase